MTQRIKVDVAMGAFDAAIGIFHHGKKDENIIRIYNPVRSINNLTRLKKQYLAEMCNPEFMDIETA